MIRQCACLVSALLSLVIAGNAAAEAQANKRYRIGFLVERGEGANALLDAFRSEVRKLGYDEGRNLAVEYRYGAFQHERMKRNGSELAVLGLDLVMVGGNEQPHLVKDVLRSTPMIVVSCDPAEYLVASLAKPGGNITGSTCLSAETAPKKLELLKELAPSVRRVAMLYNPALPGPRLALELATKASVVLGMTIVPVAVTPEMDADALLRGIGAEKPDGLFVYPEAAISRHAGAIREFANARRLPAVWGFGGFADAGGLMSYGSNLNDQFRRAAHMADKILNGANPGDIPLERPTRFELVVNLKTAKALGLTIPNTILLRADRVIE